MAFDEDFTLFPELGDEAESVGGFVQPQFDSSQDLLMDSAFELETPFLRNPRATLSTIVDPEIDGEWTVEDHEDEWQFHYQDQLYAFQCQDEKISYLTVPLALHRRREIHRMAHLRRLSHMNIGSGKLRMVLITKCEILTSLQCQSRWNPNRKHFRPGLIDPRVVTFHCKECVKGPEALRKYIQEIGLPPPSHLEQETVSNDVNETIKQARIRAFFEDPVDAAAATYMLQSDSPDFWKTAAFSHAVTKCDYTRFVAPAWGPYEIPTDLGSAGAFTLCSLTVSEPNHASHCSDGSKPAEDMADGHRALEVETTAGDANSRASTRQRVPKGPSLMTPQPSNNANVCLYQCHCSQQFKHQGQAIGHVQQMHANEHVPADSFAALVRRTEGIAEPQPCTTAMAVPASGNGMFSVPDPPQLRCVSPARVDKNHERRSSSACGLSRTASSSSFSDSGYVSGPIAAISSVPTSDCDSESAPSRRKKQPRMPSGSYQCSFSCGKSFEHAGDLRKHEKVHSAERPYHCDSCGKGFTYPKDVRRHCERLGHTSVVTENKQPEPP